MHLVKLQVHQCSQAIRSDQITSLLNGASPAVPSASGARSRFLPTMSHLNRSSPLMLDPRLIMRTTHIITAN